MRDLWALGGHWGVTSSDFSALVLTVLAQKSQYWRCPQFLEGCSNGFSKDLKCLGEVFSQLCFSFPSLPCIWERAMRNLVGLRRIFINSPALMPAFSEILPCTQERPNVGTGFVQFICFPPPLISNCIVFENIPAFHLGRSYISQGTFSQHLCPVPRLWHPFPVY